ncbi:MAG: alcohol dehydrogenase catalytic domain-containing protein [Bacteroidetes bacterium]|nr:alcohol dehydrogenase catalytic domain-containing protein [Bacteroidota bacterium]MBS1931940.1 alcohol dehydrogenase catalytic domain-containing protein [Bacteroidota bacterium]
MQALTFGGKEVIEFSTVNDPQLLHPTDAIVKITLAGICGSDLHVYHGRETGLDFGTIMGHEFTGIVEEVGNDVKKYKVGARVLSPFTTSCGECYYCRIGLTCRCEKGNLFGWMQHGHGLHGAQATYIRVPMADSTLIPLSNDLNEQKGLLLGDIFSTGYFCADNANIKPDTVHVVIGCGPVGLMTIIAAKHLGAETLFAVDIIPERLAMAKQFGSVTLNAATENVKEEILTASNGRGADSVMEVVGSDQTLKLAINLLRPGGTISSVGVHTAPNFSFSPSEAYDKNLTYKSGRCPAHHYSEKLLREEVPQRYNIENIITHQFTLREGANAYEVFDKKLDNCIKAVLLTE